jgi:hypothetical protein
MRTALYSSTRTRPVGPVFHQGRVRMYTDEFSIAETTLESSGDLHQVRAFSVQRTHEDDSRDVR